MHHDIRYCLAVGLLLIYRFDYMKGKLREARLSSTTDVDNDSDLQVLRVHNGVHYGY